LGAFLGADRVGVDAIGAFASWLGSDVSVGRTYLPGKSWDDLEGPDWALDPWSAWRAARPERMLAVNVPMVAPNEPPVSDDAAAVLLRQGADGSYDGHFRTLAERLVQRRAGDAVIVLGWEMNGTTYSGRCAPDPRAWKEYWRRIVTVMRSVPGQGFRFDFAPTRGAQAIPWPQCYPGDDVVDIVGMDSYDQRPGRTFDEFIGQPYGLRAQADFAAAHGKPLSYPEWGAKRGASSNADRLSRATCRRSNRLTPATMTRNAIVLSAMPTPAPSPATAATQSTATNSAGYTSDRRMPGDTVASS
jgi:hypothetical protein